MSQENINTVVAANSARAAPSRLIPRCIGSAALGDRAGPRRVNGLRGIVVVGEEPGDVPGMVGVEAPGLYVATRQRVLLDAEVQIRECQGVGIDPGNVELPAVIPDGV